MKTGMKVLIGLGVLVLLVIGVFVSVYNNLVNYDESIKASWAQVENVLQRRADLIPNLVNTVKGYAKHEADVLTAITQARASVGQIKVNSPEDFKKFDAAQSQLSGALSRLLVVSEKYPDLK